MRGRILLLGLMLAVSITPGRAQSIDSVLFTGRFDISDSSASFSHVSSSISANFQGTGISASFSSDYGVSYLYVILDRIDDPLNRKIIEVESGLTQQYILAEQLEEGEHHVELVKLNQYDTRLSFHGFKIDGGGLLQQPERPALSLEFYGDSNAAGHSAWDAYDWGAAAENGGYFTFPGITARLLGAEYHNISMGGAGITSGTWNLRDYYDLIHMNEPPQATNQWDFTSFRADVVLVNLGANDYYAGVTKANIKKGWKDFVNEDIRSHHPHAHIVLLNAYGWAINEPADYLHEAVEELHAEGELNVSCILIPWLWGQHHAVVNEHAGFANLLAAHLASELELPDPGSSDLSSFAPHGQLSNGSFEKSTLDGVADGWRPHGELELVDDSTEAYSGHRYLKLQSKAWANFANDAGPGETYSLTAWLRSTDPEATGALKLEFKDQEQRTITAAEDRRTLSDTWEEFSVSLASPRTVWSLWVVLEAGQANMVDFDQVELKLEEETRIKEADQSGNMLQLFPNPNNGEFLKLRNPSQLSGELVIYDMQGRYICTRKLHGEPEIRITFSEALEPGLYVLLLGAPGYQSSIRFLVY